MMLHERENFIKTIWSYYKDHRRSFVWREEISPYKVFISEVMLQQTQTDRVAKKYEPFIEAFGDFSSLAKAPFIDVLTLWKGLGYNRRALNLQKAALIISNDFDSNLPKDITALMSLPGIGKATASSIFTFAFNEPSIWIETNIRTVFLHFFFKDKEQVHDRHIEELVIQTVDHARPRDWYYALMDYGVMLKKTLGNLNHKSQHYKKQSKFIGSDRKLRGEILQFLLQHNATAQELEQAFSHEHHRLMPILKQLCQEGMIKNKQEIYFL